MQLYLIRHGQSTNNVIEDVTKREVDPPLTAVGQEQAALLGAFVAEHADGMGLTHLYASPMLRTLQTIAPIAQVIGLPVRIWKDIHEFGGMYLDSDQHPNGIGYPGLTRTEMLTQFPFADADDSITEQGWYSIEQARENETQWNTRVSNVLAEIMARTHTHDRIALVSHGLFIDNLLKALLHNMTRPQEEIFYVMNNAAITHLRLHEYLGEYYSKIHVNYINRVSHLPASLWTA